MRSETVRNAQPCPRIVPSASQQISGQSSMEKTSDEKQTVAQLAMHATKEVETLGPTNCHALISCSKTKGTHRDLARHIYVSPLYRKSVMVAEGWGLSFSILSAKHGLLDPDETIEPYDLTLKGASKRSSRNGHTKSTYRSEIPLSERSASSCWPETTITPRCLKPV
jgi:hypothetical protein